MSDTKPNVKTNLTVIYDDALNAVMRLNYNINPINTFRIYPTGAICEAYETTDELDMYIREYDNKHTLVNIREYLKLVEDMQYELETNGQ